MVPPRGPKAEASRPQAGISAQARLSLVREYMGGLDQSTGGEIGSPARHLPAFGTIYAANHLSGLTVTPARDLHS